MENKETRFKTLLDNKNFLGNLNEAIAFSKEKSSIARKAIEVSEILDNKEDVKHNLRNIAGIGVGGSSFLALTTISLAPLLTQGHSIEAGPILGMLSLSVGFGAWFMKTIMNFKKQDDDSINKEFVENRKYAQTSLDNINKEMESLNKAIKKLEKLNEDYSKNPESCKIELCKKMIEIHKEIKNFINNNQENNNEKRHLEEIVTEGTKLLSKSSLLKKLKNTSVENLNENVRKINNKI